LESVHEIFPDACALLWRNCRHGVANAVRDKICSLIYLDALAGGDSTDQLLYVDVVPHWGDYSTNIAMRTEYVSASALYTCWYKKTANGWKWNHVTDLYHIDAIEPTATFDSQAKAWAGQIWKGVPAIMINGEVLEGHITSSGIFALGSSSEET